MEEKPGFGRLLKRSRRAAHLTQGALAELAGYNSNYLSMLERGVRRPQPSTVDALSDALALSHHDRAALHAAAIPHPHQANALPRVSPPPLPLIGRDHEVSLVVGMLRCEDRRLLTLTGPGGVGKTSLAQQAAASVADTFPAGVALIDLATAQSAADMVPLLAQAFDLREMAGYSLHERLVSYLSERKALLLLDSFERIVDESAAVADLLATCRHITILVTSRISLRLQAEQEVQVRPLALPNLGVPRTTSDLLQSPAVALFVRRAILVKPELELDHAMATAIADICFHLEGLPLAIELAAARLSHLSLATIRDRLNKTLLLLTGGRRDMPARQQTMRDTIAWSYHLLAPPQQTLLCALSVFAGGWSLDAAEQIYAPDRQDAGILDGVRLLVEHSLVVPVDDVPSEPRFRMLDTIREFALERLARMKRLDTFRRRHGAYYLRLAEQAEPALQGQEQRLWYPRLIREHENLREALDFLLQAGEEEAALRLAGALWRYWQRHGDIREGRQRLKAALTAQQAPEPIRAKALWGASWLAYHQGDYAESKALSAEHLALAQIHNDRLGVRNALTGLGMVDLTEGRYAEAQRTLRKALLICLPLGNTWHSATSYLNLGNATLLMGDLTEAQSLFDHALALYQARGDEVFTARAHQHLGYVALLRQQHAQAATLFSDALKAFFMLGEQPGIADGLESMAALFSAIGHYGKAGQLSAATNILREQSSTAPLQYLCHLWQPYLSSAQEALGDTAWATAQEVGKTLTVQEAVEFATEETYQNSTP